MENIKKFIGIGLGFFLVMLCFLAIKTVFLVESATDTVKETKNTIQEAKKFIQEAKPETISTLKSINKSTSENAEILARPEVQRGIKLFAQSGDDWARLPANLNGAIHELRQATLPRANNLIDSGKSLADQGTKTLEAAEKVELTLDKKLDKLSDIAAKDLEQLSQLLTDPKLNELLGNITQTSLSIKNTANNVDISTRDVQKAIPQLLEELTQISKHTDDSSKEIAKFLKTLNKPVSKKEKVFKYILEALIKSSPSLLRR